MENLSMIEDDLCSVIDYLKLLKLPFEVCGRFLWINGDASDYKRTLIRLGFRWSFKKKRFFYKSCNASNRRSGEFWSMEKIRSTYGSTVVDNR